MIKLMSMVLVCTMAFGSADAWAKRMGGGKSFGKQSNQVTQRESAPANNAAPTSPAAQPAAANRPANTPAAAPAKRPWGAMLGGLAAGLGLAWLASSLGLGEGFGQVLLFLLAGVAIWAVIRMVLRNRAPQRDPLAYQGAATSPRNYNSQNVGNDASARPWEAAPAAFTSAQANTGGSMIGSALTGSQSWGIPAGFDVDGFLAASKKNFMSLQAAWDRADISSLRAMMTDGMLAEIQTQLAERVGGAVNQTEVLVLEARLLGIEEFDSEYMASVEFSGMVREEASAGPNPFREVWNITRPKNGPGGWLVAGVQAME